MLNHHLLLALAARQHSSVAVRQLKALGATRSEVAHLTTSGEWERITESVLRLAGSPAARGQRAVEAVLDAGENAALSHRSDAAWWRLSGFHLADLEVTRLRNSSSQPARLARVIHEPRYFPDHHRTVLDGVPVIVPSRIPFDLSDIVAGPDVIVGTGGADTVNTGKGSDAAVGGNGDDQLSGGSGNDGLKGGGGNDRLVGGTNRDTCEGQTGVDIAQSCEVITGVP